MTVSQVVNPAQVTFTVLVAVYTLRCARVVGLQEIASNRVSVEAPVTSVIVVVPDGIFVTTPLQVNGPTAGIEIVVVF